MKTMKQIGAALLDAPGTVFSKLVGWTFGVTNEDKQTSRSLVGLLGQALAFVGNKVGDFVKEHKRAIAIAFWASLMVAGAVALTLFLWPAALAALTTFSIAGLTVAGVVGGNALLQIGVFASLAVAVTSAVTFAAAAGHNFISAASRFAKNHFSFRTDPANDYASAGKSGRAGLAPALAAPAANSATGLNYESVSHSGPRHYASPLTDAVAADAVAADADAVAADAVAADNVSITSTPT